MDIFIAQFDSSGNPVPSGTPVGVQVNSTDPAGSGFSQESPAVSFVGNNIVVVFEGPDKTCAARRRIYARRYQWSATTQPVALDAEEFTVDSDTRTIVNQFVVPNNRATVALTTSTQPADSGKFFVAWHAVPYDSAPILEIRGQYFNADGTRQGGEFRVNQDNSPTETGGTASRRWLPLSSAHAAVYGPSKQVIVTWNAGLDQLKGVFYTYLPPNYSSAVPTTCKAGDLNGDGATNGGDIQRFVQYWLAPGIPGSLSDNERARLLCALDMDANGIATPDPFDRAVFLWLLLGFHPDASPETDCNGNCRPDYVDATLYQFYPWSDQCCITQPGTSPPAAWVCCNSNPNPPSMDGCVCCEFDEQMRPDCSQFYPYSDDCPVTPPPVIIIDCNENEIDDATDIAEETSVDCNSDGVPDECQIVFYDCNSNGVLDQCDVDPGDPDGDESASPDCNSNGLPDECDLVLVYFPSYDCNTNGIPDECDIANETSVDCNTNGVPDECDIGAETSADADTNGVPDECEQESMMMGGGGGEDDGPPSSPYDNPAWETFWQWQSDNAATLAAMSPWNRYKATIDKLVELGLPPAIPWARVPESSP